MSELEEGQFLLLLTAGGGAELQDDEEELVWSSDDDDDFAARFPDFLKESDVEGILEYLVECGELTDDEADDVEIEMEFAQPDPGPTD